MMYENALESGWWHNTYAAHSKEAYFVSGARGFGLNIFVYQKLVVIKEKGLHLALYKKNRRKLMSYICTVKCSMKSGLLLF